MSDGKRVPAAYFLEKVGAKTLKVGGASVYSGHSNFIINQKNASAQDVVQLAQELKQQADLFIELADIIPHIKQLSKT